MNKKIRILSLDGGGIRGIISCVILKYIEEQLQQQDGPTAKIGDYFDLIAGSSTGGLITSISRRKQTSKIFCRRSTKPIRQKRRGHF